MPTLCQSILSVLHTEYQFFSTTTLTLKFSRKSNHNYNHPNVKFKKKYTGGNKPPRTLSLAESRLNEMIYHCFQFHNNNITMSSTLRGERSETSSRKHPLQVFVFLPPLFYAFIFLRQLFSLVIFFTRCIHRPTTALLHGAYDISYDVKYIYTTVNTVQYTIDIVIQTLNR